MNKKAAVLLALLSLATLSSVPASALDEDTKTLPACPPSHLSEDYSQIIWDTPDGQGPDYDCNGEGYVELPSTTTTIVCAPNEITYDGACLLQESEPYATSTKPSYVPTIAVSVTPRFTG